MKKPAKKKRETLADVSRKAKVAVLLAEQARDLAQRWGPQSNALDKGFQDLANQIERLKAMHAEHARFLQNLKKENEDMKHRLIALEVRTPATSVQREKGPTLALFEVEGLIRAASGKP